MLDCNCKRDKAKLVFWEQVHAVQEISCKQERQREALQLHVAHWTIAQGTHMDNVDGAEAEELLRAKAERLLHQLQDQWLTTCAHCRP